MDAFQTLRSEIQETEQEVKYLKGELKDLEDTDTAFRQTDDYRELTGEIGRTRKKLEEYRDLRSSMLLDGSNLKETEAFQKAGLAITDAENRLRSLNAQKTSMEKSGLDVRYSDRTRNAASGALSKAWNGMKAVMGR